MSTFADAVLVEDADLKKHESKMPDLAIRLKAYDGKRELAKLYLAKRLRQRNVGLDKIADPSQLKTAAVYKELELIYRDLSEKTESIASDKADYYSRMFEEELTILALDLTDGARVNPSPTSIPAYRA